MVQQQPVILEMHTTGMHQSLTLLMMFHYAYRHFSSITILRDFTQHLIETDADTQNQTSGGDWNPQEEFRG